MENSELKVETVKAINPTTIQVTFNEDVTEEALATSNFSLSKGNIEAVTATGNVATISVGGLTYGDVVTVTVAEPAYTKEVTVPEVSELFLLDVEAEEDVLLSDGASRTVITVTLKDRATGEVVDQDGVVQFQATNGGLGQTTSALVDGKATVQLTSEASATSITSIITATISDGGEFKGLTAQKAIVFSPNPAEEEVVQFVTPVYAEAKAGDRFFVQFSEKISAAAYKEIAKEEGYGIQIDGKLVKVIDVKQATDNALEFILDTDHNTNIRIEKAGDSKTWPGADASKGNYLRDNVTHTVEFVGNDLVLSNVGSGIDFILTDTSRPAVLGVTAKDQLEFTVRFTEAVDRSTVIGEGENFLIDGREIALVKSNPTPTEIADAKAANQVILTDLQVGTYYKTINNEVTAVDERNLVTFKLHKDFALEEGVHQIQVANVGDYAQDVDPVQNKVVTDTFDFNVVADKSIPVPVIEVQSAEQWKVSFDKQVYGVTGKTIKDVFAIKSADSTDTFEMDTDYIVSSINEDGTTGAKLNPDANASTLDGEQYFLIEFTQDWTEKYDTAANPTKTYFASTKNPFVVTIDNLESAIGNKVGEKELNVTLSYDGQSPEIASATQDGDTSAVRVVMTEPVKNVVVNNEGLTPSQQQAQGLGNPADGVPVPTYEFVKGDKVVKAEVVPGTASYDNYAFTLRPENNQSLDAGEWTLYIRSISDDIGNTSATVSTKVTIVAPEQEATNTRIAWAAFDDADGASKLLHGTKHTDKDVIYVKFTKVMKSDGTNGVSRTQNYVFQGQPLPTGSQVLKGIAGVTNDWDGVTIVMPKGTWNGTGTGNNDFTTALNIASNFQAADGEKLSGAHEVELTDTATTTSTLGTGFEAAYADAGETTTKPNQVTFGGLAQVKGASIEDTGITTDGKIKQVELVLDKENAALAVGQEVLVNGKTFVTITGNVLQAKTANDQIDGTAANNLKITGKDGSIIVNKGSVVDNAAPVITKAVLKDGKVTVTFSEAVYENAALEELETAGKFLVGGTAATSVEQTSPTTVVLTISNASTLTTASTINVGTGAVLDATGNSWSAAFSPIEGTPTQASVDAATAQAAANAAVADTGVTGYNGTAGTITLPATVNSETVTWTSDTITVIPDGSGSLTVTRPAYGVADATVTLTASVTVGTETKTATVPVNVLAHTIDASSTVDTPAEVTTANADATFTITLVDTDGNPVTGLVNADFTIVGDAAAGTSKLGTITVVEDGSTAGTYNVTVVTTGATNSDNGTENLTITVDGVELTTKPAVTIAIS